MFKKVFLSVLIVAIGMLGFGLAQAAQIDGLNNNGGPALPIDLTAYVNPGGTGDALVGAYYNVRGGALNFIRLVNTSENTGVAVKIRFREGVYSNEVLDFFICLSAADQWSGWLLENGSVGALFSWDSDTPTVPDTTLGDILNFSTDAGKVVTGDMTKEGYFEIIGAVGWADTAGSKKNIADSKECEQVLGLSGTPPVEVIDAPNSLAATNVLFDLAGGNAVAYNLTAIADCRATPITSNSLLTDNPPRLDNCDDGIQGINFILTKAYEYATYDLEFDGSTDIINTFPTKRMSIMDLDGLPFDSRAIEDNDGRLCIDDNGDGDCNDANDSLKVCVEVTMTPYDDEENTISPETGFSPGKPTKLKKCNEVSLVTVGDGNKLPIFDSTLVDINLNVGTFQLGWVKEDFVKGGYSTTYPESAITAKGLPVISYELSNLVGGAYSWMLPLRYSTDIGID